MFELAMINLAIRAGVIFAELLAKNETVKDTGPAANTDVERVQEVKIVDVVETEREEEFIGRDTPKRCDNRKSQSETKLTIRASRTWRRQTTMQVERMRTAGGTANVGFAKFITANFQATLQQAIHESFSATDELTRTFEQSFEVSVPPGVLQTVTLEWKRIWQLGYIEMLVNDIQVELPFKVLIDIDFDQIHETVC